MRSMSLNRELVVHAKCAPNRMTTRSRDDAARGEPFAEQYANQYADTIWDRCLTAFGW
jgi:hypothetical protein